MCFRGRGREERREGESGNSYLFMCLRGRGWREGQGESGNSYAFMCFRGVERREEGGESDNSYVVMCCRRGEEGRVVWKLICVYRLHGERWRRGEGRREGDSGN